MNMVRWQPGTLVRTPITNGSFDTEIDRIFDWAFGRGAVRTPSATPALDVVEEDQRYTVRVDLPGLRREDVEVTFQEGVLSIKGEKKAENRSENHRLHLQERFRGEFVRNLRIPERVDADQIQATMKDGVLEVTLPFVPELQPRKIPVKE